jgi:hypothetical protein
MSGARLVGRRRALSISSEAPAPFRRSVVKARAASRVRQASRSDSALSWSSGLSSPLLLGVAGIRILQFLVERRCASAETCSACAGEPLGQAHHEGAVLRPGSHSWRKACTDVLGGYRSACVSAGHPKVGAYQAQPLVPVPDLQPRPPHRQQEPRDPAVADEIVEYDLYHAHWKHSSRAAPARHLGHA